MSAVKVGVVGAGYWGPNLIRNFLEMPEVELGMVVDRRQERLDAIKQRFPGVHTTTNLADLLASDIEAVAIATPVSTHCKIGEQCLQAGKHILVEKPLACTSNEAKYLVSLSNQVGKLIVTGHTFVFNPAVRAIRDLITSGELGDMYYINSTRVNLGLYQPDVNVIWDLAPHDISILLYVLGMEPAYVSARGGMFACAGQFDVAYITLYYPNNVMANLRVSWLDPLKVRQTTFVGQKKMVVYDDIEPVDKVKIFDKGVDFEPYVQPYSYTFEEFHMSYRQGEARNVPLQWEEPLRAECNHFVECVQTNTASPLSDGTMGLRVVSILEAADRSLKNGHEKETIQW